LAGAILSPLLRTVKSNIILFCTRKLRLRAYQWSSTIHISQFHIYFHQIQKVCLFLRLALLGLSKQVLIFKNQPFFSQNNDLTKLQETSLAHNSNFSYNQLACQDYDNQSQVSTVLHYLLPNNEPLDQ
jgi:hypothetical protein